MKLSENIQKFRKKKGFSQEKLAEKCQVSRQAIAKWENGESVPTIDKLIFLADLYELSLDELVGRTEKDTSIKVREYLKKFLAEDVPDDSEDDISAIVVRYLNFVERMGLTNEDKLKGLEEIFLDFSSVNK